jgi:hypothetical protein
MGHNKNIDLQSGGLGREDLVTMSDDGEQIRWLVKMKLRALFHEEGKRIKATRHDTKAEKIRPTKSSQRIENHAVKKERGHRVKEART